MANRQILERSRLAYPRLERNEPCWCGCGKKYKKCHMEFDERIIAFERQGHIVPTRDLLKTAEDIEGIKKSAVINMTVLDEVAAVIHAGMTTQEIDDLVYSVTTKMGGIPADLNYQGYPKSVCTSIDDVVCHGIPSDKTILKEGDIVNVDCSTILNGYVSDSSRMFMIGEVSDEKRKLVEVTRECMLKGLEQVIPWHFMGDMGAAVNAHAKANGYSVVREIGGHGCGNAFHEEPFVSYVSAPGTEMLMVPGMVFTIEPMVNMGSNRVYEDEDDGWTIRTRDGLPSAQWEIEVLVTETGHEVLCS